MGVVAVVASLALDERLVDPDGFLGPSWVRLPRWCSAPSSSTSCRGRCGAPGAPQAVAAHRRGAGSRALDPRADRPGRHRADQLLHHLRQLPEPQELPARSSSAMETHDRCCTSSTCGCSSATSRRPCCTRSSARRRRPRLAFIYLLYLPLAPLAWSCGWSGRATSATATGTPPRNCLTWTLGTISYYLIPTMGPDFCVPLALPDLEVTGVDRAAGLAVERRAGRPVPLNPFSDSIQSVAGFASPARRASPWSSR